MTDVWQLHAKTPLCVTGWNCVAAWPQAKVANSIIGHAETHFMRGYTGRKCRNGECRRDEILGQPMMRAKDYYGIKPNS